MSNIHHIHSHKENKAEELRLDQASDWIARLDRELSETEKGAFQRWLAQDHENSNVLMEMAKMWDKMDDLSRLSDLFPQSHTAAKSAANKTAVKKRQRQNHWVTGLAASLVVAITLSVIKFSGIDIADIYATVNKNDSSVIVMQASYQTSVGESKTINLPDNSKLVLNTNSFVQVKYTQAARLIELQRGEIHVDVAHDKSRPLSVFANGKIIQAVGTAFNVEVRNDLVELIVTEGKVLVAKKENLSLNSDIETMAKRLPQNSMAISKGEKVDLDLTTESTEHIIKLAPAEIAASLSWRRGNLIFRGESLEQAMAEISRYTNIEFELADELKLKNVHVAGMFKTGDVNGLLNVLNQNFNISAEKISTDKIILKFSG